MSQQLSSRYSTVVVVIVVIAAESEFALPKRFVQYNIRFRVQIISDPFCKEELPTVYFPHPLNCSGAPSLRRDHHTAVSDVSLRL
jgi:hypothetical protein